MDEQQDRDQKELDFTGLMPEEQHTCVCSEWPKKCNQQKLRLWNPPSSSLTFQLVHSKEHQREDVHYHEHNKQSWSLEHSNARVLL